MGLEGGPRRALGKGGLEGLGAGGGGVACEDPAGLVGARHIGDASGIASENGRATSETFENGVGEVVCAAGAKEQVTGGVVPGKSVGAPNMAGVMNGEVGGERVIGLLAPNEEAEVRAIYLVQGAGDDVEAFAGVGPSGSVAEPNAVGIEAEGLLTGGGVLPSEGVEVDAVGDVFYGDVAGGVLLGGVGEPLAGGNEGGGSGTGKEGFPAGEGGLSGPVDGGGLGGAEAGVFPRVSLGGEGPAIMEGPNQRQIDRQGVVVKAAVVDVMNI